MEGARPKGRPKTLGEIVEKDCQAHKLNRWRKQIRLKIDDHDRCQWVNVFSGTDSPGLSRKKFREL